MPTLKISDLNKNYQEAESCDQLLFAEQRSNVQLVSGDHYLRRGSRFWDRVRDTKQLTQEQKLRLTKNHTQKITKTYINNIVSFAPGVEAVPKNETELQDKKAAELNQAVIQDLKHRHKMREKVREFAEDYINIGEAVVKIFWNPNSGQLKGYEAEMDESGQPVLDPMTGQMTPSKRAVFAGDFEFERFFGFNLLRSASAKSMADSPFLILRKMSAIKDLKTMIEGSDMSDEDKEEKLGYLKNGQKDTFLIFEGSRGEYTKSKDEILIMEHHFRSCSEYPNGYYYICTEYGILFEGEHPFGKFPIKYVGFDQIPTQPRAHSIIKVLRPYNAEINRSASKIAEHQITLGDDKLLIQAGTKVTHGGQLPGVRSIQFQGMAPQILAGRSGDQYLTYMQSQIQEMYQVSNVFEDSEEIKANLDPFALLWRSIRHKKKFSFYGEKFEDFLVDFWETVLELAKKYYTDDHLIPAIGRREYVNIAEFRNTDPLYYQIKIEPRSDDIESLMGKQIQMNHVLQYVGGQLNKEDIGRMLRAMPFMEGEDAWGDFTLDYDNAVNDILALDRGEYPAPNVYDDHAYMLKRLSNRMKQSDYRLLAPNVQANYEKKKQEHEGYEAFQQDKIMHAKSGYIPTGGYMVVCDIYVPDPEDPNKTRRARIPYEALDWLIKRLEEQGTFMGSLQGMGTPLLADLADKALQSQNSPQAPQQPGAQAGGYSPVPPRDPRGMPGRPAQAMPQAGGM